MRTAAASLLALAFPAAAASQILREAAPRTFTVVPAGAPPVYLRASPSPNSVYLRWGCPEGASAYDVYVTPAGGGQVKLTPGPIPGQCVQDVQATLSLSLGLPAPSTAPTYSLGFTHSGVIPGSSYSYVVVALYPNGASGATAPVSATATLASPPAGFAAVANGRSAELRWQAVSGATGYKIFRKLAGEAGFRELWTLGAIATSSADPALLPPGQHQYYVQALNGLPSAAATVSIPLLPAPPAVNAMAFSYDVVDVRWQLPFDLRLTPRGYLVFRQREGEAGFTQLNATPIPALSYQDRGLRPGQRVSYYVKGVDAEPSAPVSVVPGVVRVVSLVGYCGKGSLDFSYSGAGGSTAVNVLRGGTPNGPWYVAAVYAAGSGVIRTMTNPLGVLQYYKVQAIYPTGTMESGLVSLAIPVEPNKDPLISSYFREVAPGISIEWQCPAVK